MNTVRLVESTDGIYDVSGLEITMPQPLTINISPGTLSYQGNIYNYEELTIDIEPDTTIPLHITIYFDTNGEWQILSWLQGETMCPKLTSEIIGHIVSLEIPANCINLNDAYIENIVFVKPIGGQ